MTFYALPLKSKSHRSFRIFWDTGWLFLSYLIISSAFRVLHIGPWWFTPVCLAAAIPAYGAVLCWPRLARRLTAGTEAPDRYAEVTSHVAEHYPTDRVGVERLIRLLLLQMLRFVEQVLQLIVSLSFVLTNHLPVGNQRLYRTLTQTTTQRYVLLTTDRVLRAPPVLL